MSPILTIGEAQTQEVQATQLGQNARLGIGTFAPPPFVVLS